MPSARHSTSSRSSRRSAPGLQARAGVLTGEAAVTVGAEAQGMVAGDLVNTAVAAPVGRPAGRRPRRRRHQARRQRARSPSSRPASSRSRASSSRSRPGGPCGSSPSAAARAASDAPRAAVRRPGRGAPPAQGPVPRHRRASAAPRLVSIIGQAGIGKSRPRVGVREVHRRGRRARLLARRPLARPTARASRFWALGEMVRSRAGLAETRRRGHDPRDASPRRVGRLRARRGRARAGSSRAARSCSASARRAPAEREELFARVADVLRAHRRAGPDGPGLRGPRSGPTRAARLHRPPARVVATVSRSSIVTLARPGAARAAARTGAPGTGTSPRSASSRSPTRRCASCSPASCRACPRRPCARSSRAPRACRCTRSRPSGCCVDRGPARRAATASTSRSATCGWRPGHAARADRRAPRRARPRGPDAAPGRVGPRPDVHDRRRWPASAAARGRARAAPALARPPGAPRRSNADPRSPERGQYGFVQALVREVAYSTLRDAIGGRGTSRRRATSRRWATMSLRVCSRCTTSDAWKAAPEGPEGDAVAAQARVALRAAAERAAALHSPAQAGAYLVHLLSVTSEPAERGSILERAAESAEAGAPLRARRGLCARGAGCLSLENRLSGSLAVRFSLARRASAQT